MGQARLIYDRFGSYGWMFVLGLAACLVMSAFKPARPEIPDACNAQMTRLALAR